MNPQQKEQKVYLEKFKQSINQWVTKVPNLTTPHYNEGDDLMNPEAYDKIRELISNDLLPLSSGRSEINEFREYPFYENWQIDKNLNKLLTFTQRRLKICDDCIGKTPQEQARRQQIFNSRGISSQTARFASVCYELRNIIEKNLPFTVFYLISNTQGDFRIPYTHSVYVNGKPDERYVMRPEEKHLFGIIINQDSKIKQLEERIERMESWNRQNFQDKQIETKKLSEMFTSLDSRIETITGINESVKTLSYLVQKDKKELLGQISNVRKQLLDIDRKIHEMKNHKQNNVPVDDLIDLTPSNNPFDEFH